MQGVHNFLLHNFVCVFPRFQSKTRLQSVSCSSFPSLEKKKNKNQNKKKPRREKKKEGKGPLQPHFTRIVDFVVSCFACQFLSPASCNHRLQIPFLYHQRLTFIQRIAIHFFPLRYLKKNTTSRHPSVIFAERGGVAY